MTKDEVAKVLEDMAQRVREGDSFDGSIRYEMLAPGLFDVQAAFRTGNLKGQGGVTIIDSRGKGLAG
jgi:hypothetical protein